MRRKYLIVGAGLSGAVIAEHLSRNKNNLIFVLEERDHIGGNCFTEVDGRTGIIEHKYGPHIFNTDDEKTWSYLSRFCTMKPFINRVKAVYKGEVYSIPVNLHTINQFFRKNLNPADARSFIESIGNKNIHTPANFEELALKTIGPDLYKAFFYSYSKKQWGCEPSSLPVSILQRLPVRFDYNDNYYENRFQGIPENGYTPLFEMMLDRASIKIMLNQKFDDTASIDEFDHVFYTGRIDEFFNYRFGRLNYRTVYFEKEYVKGDYQGNAVINYTDESVAYTRIHEHMHFTPWKKFRESIVFREYSKETGEKDIPFYPKRLADDLLKFNLYREEAKKFPKFTFAGRLGTYRYMDMQHVIKESIEIAAKFLDL